MTEAVRISCRAVVLAIAVICTSAWIISGTRGHIKTSGQKFPQYNNNVWVLGEGDNYTDKYDVLSSGCDTTNIAAVTTDHMHVDYYTTVENIRMIRFNFLFPVDFVAIRMINEEEQDEVFVAVHEGHMTVNRFGNFTTFPIPVKKSSSLFVIGNLACVIPATSDNGEPTGKDPFRNGIKTVHDNRPNSHSSVDYTHILCVNVIKGTYLSCPDKVVPGSHGYTDVAHSKQQLAFVIDPDKQIIQSFKIDNDCVSLVRTSLTGNYGNHLWFSYEGSRMFLQNGLTLAADDFSQMGTLAGRTVGQYRYGWVSQLYRTELLSRGERHDVNLAERDRGERNLNSGYSIKGREVKSSRRSYQDQKERPIMALRDDVMDKVFYYTWPELQANGTEAIPVPSGYTMIRPISLHYCQPDFAYALVTYRQDKSGTLRTGVAYVKHDW